MSRYINEIANEMDRMTIFAGPTTKADILNKAAAKLELRYGQRHIEPSPQEVRRIITETAAIIIEGKPTNS